MFFSLFLLIIILFSIITSSAYTSNQTALLIIAFVVCYVPVTISVILQLFIDSQWCPYIEYCEKIIFQQFASLMYASQVCSIFWALRCTVDPIIGLLADSRLRSCGWQLLILFRNIFERK